MGPSAGRGRRFAESVTVRTITETAIATSKQADIASRHLTLLIWLLTHLERALTRPVRDRRKTSRHRTEQRSGLAGTRRRRLPDISLLSGAGQGG
jgi:hypothetical protein